MNLADTLRGFRRRWYVVLPGIVVALAVALGTWHVVKPQHERTASQVLLPGTATLPATSRNPYLFIGGLTDAADVVVRTVGSNNVMNDITSRHPGIKVKVERDPTTAGPVILTTVTATNDREAAAVLQLLLQRAKTTLTHLQTQEGIAPKAQIVATTLSVDNHGKLKQKKRLMATGASGAGILLLTLILASVLEGWRQPRELAHGRHQNGTFQRRDLTPNDRDNADIDQVDVPEAQRLPVVEIDTPDEFEPAVGGFTEPTSSHGPRRASVGAGFGGASWRD